MLSLFDLLQILNYVQNLEQEKLLKEILERIKDVQLNESGRDIPKETRKQSEL